MTYRQMYQYLFPEEFNEDGRKKRGGGARGFIAPEATVWRHIRGSRSWVFDGFHHGFTEGQTFHPRRDRREESRQPPGQACKFLSTAALVFSHFRIVREDS